MLRMFKTEKGYSFQADKIRIEGSKEEFLEKLDKFIKTCETMNMLAEAKNSPIDGKTFTGVHLVRDELNFITKP